MEAYNRFTKCIFEWERALLKCVGHDFLAVKLKQTPMTFIIYGTFLFNLPLQFYTFFYYGILEKIYSLHTFAIAMEVRYESRYEYHHRFFFFAIM